MKKILRFFLTSLSTVVASVVLTDFFDLGVATMVLMATIGSLTCLLVFIIIPRIRLQTAEREYRQLLREGMHLIVGRARYRGRRVLHYADGSVAVETSRGMLAFDNFDSCRQFIDGR